MTKDEQDLLVSDLCMRLPYGVKMGLDDFTADLDNFEQSSTMLSTIRDVVDAGWKPYLRPLSDLNKEEYDKYYKTLIIVTNDYDDHSVNEYETLDTYMYLCSIHVDFRGLLNKALAIRAPEGMYNTQKD